MDAKVSQTGSQTPEIERIDSHKRPTREEAEAAVRTLLAWAGDHPDREGLIDTPARVVKAYEELFAGYTQEAAKFLERTFKEVSGYDDMVLVCNVPFFSHCEHHVLPFKGVTHIAYFPTDRVVGLSKLARIVDSFSKRLQTQEKLTAQIANCINDNLKPSGVAVMLEAEHSCMSMRGIQKAGMTTITSRFHGIFENDPAEQARFMSLVHAQSVN